MNNIDRAAAEETIRETARFCPCEGCTLYHQIESASRQIIDRLISVQRRLETGNYGGHELGELRELVSAYEAAVGAYAKESTRQPRIISNNT